MADGGGIDTSMYKDAVGPSTMESVGQVADTVNKLQSGAIQRQTMQSNQIGIDSAKVDLALKQFGNMRSMLGALLADPDAGKKDLSKRIQEEIVKGTRMGMWTPEQAVEGMKTIPSDPRQQYQWLTNQQVNLQSATERMNALFGPVQSNQTGGGTVQTQTPQLPGLPVRQRGSIAGTLPPTTQTPTGPGGAAEFVGQPGVGTVTQGPDSQRVVPPAAAPAPRVPMPNGTPPQANGAPPPPAIAKVPAGLPPGTTEALGGGSKMLVDAREAAGDYGARVNPLRQAIPLISKMKETDIGPTSERWNDVKSTIQTLGGGKLAGIDPEKIKDYNELKKYLTQYTSMRAATLGPKTNDGLATAVTSNPNVNMDKLSVLELSKMAMALERMRQAAVLEFEDKLAKREVTEGQFGTFMAKWGRDMDPRGFVYDLLDGKAQKKMMEGLSPAQLAKIQQSAEVADKHGLLGDVNGR